jgi:hypothetical protein
MLGGKNPAARLTAYKLLNFDYSVATCIELCKRTTPISGKATDRAAHIKHRSRIDFQSQAIDHDLESWLPHPHPLVHTAEYTLALDY